MNILNLNLLIFNNFVYTFYTERDRKNKQKNSQNILYTLSNRNGNQANAS